MLDPTDAAWELVQGIISVPLVHENQNAPRPALPFAVLDFIAEQPPHASTADPLDVDGNTTRRAQSSATVSVTFYGAGSQAAAKTLWLKLDSARMIEAAWLLELGIGRRIAFRDETALMRGAEYEPRYACEFDLLWLASVAENVGLLDTVEVTSNSADGALSFIETTTIEGL